MPIAEQKGTLLIFRDEPWGNEPSQRKISDVPFLRAITSSVFAEDATARTTSRIKNQ
jgi:hypothetical protein